MLLPKLLGGEMWHLNATGGTGYYKWNILDQNVATISVTGLVISKEIGKTVIEVHDFKNPKNYDRVKLEVSHVNALTWFEPHLEI